MLKHLLLVACCLLVAVPAAAQCCLGAQNVEATSVGGAWKVTATSLTGTGPKHHGPYHFLFLYLKRMPDGRYAEESTFELKWDTRCHFGMTLFVSPTGNGVAIELPNEQLGFYTKHGRKLFDSGPGIPVELSDDGHSVLLCGVVKLRARNTVVAGCYVEEGRVFLPLGVRVTPELDRQVIYYLSRTAQREREAREEMPALIRALQSSDTDKRKVAAQVLKDHGCLSVGPLEKELRQARDEAYRGRLKQLLHSVRMWAHLPRPLAWYDLTFLLSLTHYPDEMIRYGAAHSILHVIDPSLRKYTVNEVYGSGRVKERLSEIAQWARDNRARLRWDPKKSFYVLRK